jgi:hypothetical protein
MKKYIFLAILFPFAFGCKKNSTSGGSGTVDPNPIVIPSVYAKIYGATSITSDGTYLTVKSKGLPDHKSCYWANTNSNYEAFPNGSITFNGEIFQRAPNNITEMSYVFKIPLTPALNTAHAATPMGPIGFALDGIPLFNQYAAAGAALGNEKKGFDQYYGHPQAQGAYHYHVEPLYLTAVKYNKSALVGFLLDGFPVYGPEENGVAVSNSNLDVYHGHTSATTDFPNGIYHYHFTSADPYLNGTGFYGTPGTVTQ